MAKCMDKATKGTYLEMLRMVKFLIYAMLLENWQSALTRQQKELILKC
jgi:hypothetical protein